MRISEITKILLNLPVYNEKYVEVDKINALVSTLQKCSDSVPEKTPLITIQTIVKIGKSQTETAYIFKTTDFVRIEGDYLILNSDKRRLKLSLDEIKSVLLQINGMMELRNDR